MSQGSLAQHWHLAGCPDRAAPAALAAARQAVSARAYPEAVRDYALAIDLESWLPEAGPDLFEEAAQAASWAGDPERAAGWMPRPRWPGPDAATGPTGCGGWSGSGVTGGRPVTRTPPSMPAKRRWRCFPTARRPPLRARVLAALATHRMLLGEFAEALPAAERAVARGRQAGAVAEQAHGLATLGIILAQRGDLDAGMAALRTSFTLARRAGNIEDVVRAATSHMYLLCTAGRFTEALEVARAGPARPPGPWTRRPR